MREAEKFGCPNIDCGYIGFSGGECPECGSQLVSNRDIYNTAEYEDDQNEPLASEFDDDPEAVNWYSDGEEGCSVV